MDGKARMRIVIAGGGTGGHFFPGLAVAEHLAGECAAIVSFVGSDDGIEARAAPARGFPFVAVRMLAFRGGGLRGTIRSLARLPVAVLAAARVLRTLAPDLVVGLGSYASVPVVLAARWLRVPVVLMEQNVVPGFANRLLGRFAERICTAFAQSAGYFPKGRTVQTGNPVRALTTDRKPAPQGFTVFAFGGSQGAHSLNIAMVAAVEELSERLPELQIVHQTGAADADFVAGAYRERGVRAEVYAFIDDMADAYGRADLVVSRAGASTLAELAALAKPAILVPYPVAADDHQRKNAEVVVQAGAALMILDRDLSGRSLAAAIEDLATDPRRRQAMAEAVAAFAAPDATERVVDVCRAVAEVES